MIVLTNTDTAASYEALTDIDQFVDIPARKGQGTCYRGMISAITPEAAERYVRFGGNLIARKQTPAAAAVEEKSEEKISINKKNFTPPTGGDGGKK